MIIGSGQAHERVSIHGGGVALGMAGSSLFSALNYGKQFKFQSVSNSDPSIQVKQNDQIILDMGHHSIGIGQENDLDTVMTARSINGKSARIESPQRSALILNHGSGYSFENNNKQFSIAGANKDKPYMHVQIS